MKRLARIICLMVSILSVSCVSQSQKPVASTNAQSAAVAHADNATTPTATRPKAPRVGDKAPLFVLTTFDDKTKKESLAGLIKNKPTVLFFGSYT